MNLLLRQLHWGIKLLSWGKQVNLLGRENLYWGEQGSRARDLIKSLLGNQIPFYHDSTGEKAFYRRIRLLEHGQCIEMCFAEDMRILERRKSHLDILNWGMRISH